MFDTMTLTKVVGGLCGTFLVFLLGLWAGESIYHVGGDGHGDHEQAYVIDTGADLGGDAGHAVEAGPSFDEAFAVASGTDGAKLFRQCQACHKIEEGKNGTGPSLYGIVGRAVGKAEGFTFSSALAQSPDVWTPENLNGFLENPKTYAPGTKMSYKGMADVADRANLIAYLDSIDG